MRLITVVGVSVVSVLAGFGVAQIFNRAENSASLPAPAIHSHVASDAPAPPLLLEVERASPGVERMRLIYERAAALSPAELDSTANSILNAAHSPARAALLAALLERWVELDAAAAKEFLYARVPVSDTAYSRWFAAWYRTWLDVDYASAIQHARDIQNSEQRDVALRLAMEWAGEGALSDQLFADLSSAARMAVSTARSQGLTPAAAFAESLRHADPDQRFELMRNAFARLLHADSAQAFAQLERIPADERDAVASAVAQWAHAQPSQAWQQLNRSELPATYRAAMLSALAEHQPQQALDWLRAEHLQRPDAKPQIELYRAALPALLQADLNSAARAVAELRTHAPMDLIQQVAVEYAKQSPQAMYSWANDLAHRSDFEKTQTLHAVSASLVAADPNAAQTYLRYTQDVTVRSSLLKEIASHKAQAHVRDGWEWLNRYRDDASYRENARALLNQWSVTKPAEVGDVVRSIPDAEFQRALAEQLASVWREQDETAFRTWTTSLSPELRATLLNGNGS